MIVCHAGRWIAFAPWKTASSTLRLRLDHYNQSPYSRFYQFNPHLNRVVHQHITCSDFIALPESRLNYATFSFIRNPYDRCYSGFIQLQRAVRHQPGMTFETPWIRSLVMAQLAEIEKDLAAAGGEFDAWMSTVREEQVFDIGRNTTFVLHPAHYWTHVDGHQFVQEIGRVENFEEDFRRICKTFAIEASNGQNANVTSDVPRPGTYQYASRIGRAARNRINELFAQDFALFGYDKIT